MLISDSNNGTSLASLSTLNNKIQMDGSTGKSAECLETFWNSQGLNNQWQTHTHTWVTGRKWALWLCQQALRRRTQPYVLLTVLKLSELSRKGKPFLFDEHSFFDHVRWLGLWEMEHTQNVICAWYKSNTKYEPVPKIVHCFELSH